MKKVILITGGGRGIGAATSLLAAQAGYHVAVNYRVNQDAANEVVSKIKEIGGTAIAVRADVAIEEDVVRMFREVDEKLGSLTALVNNAGILQKQCKVIDLDGPRLQRIFAANSIGPILCSREAIKRMSRSNGGNGGAIVNISSTAIKHGGAFEYADYAASKGAVEVFTLGLAKEVAPEGIRVNAVRPGSVYTEIHTDGGEPGRVDRIKDGIPLKRGGQPEEIAKAVLWLISDEASYCAGSILDVSGGK